MYKIGDFVVYRLLTVCKIVGIEAPTFESDKEKKYYVLSPVFENGNATTIYLPISTNDTLRPVATKKQAEAALFALPSLNPTVCALKKPPQLTAYYQEILLSCEHLRYLSLLKEVSRKERTAKKLSEIDAKFRAKTEKLLCAEFAVSLECSPEDIKERIAKGL